jgi:hypothetical protein
MSPTSIFYSQTAIEHFGRFDIVVAYAALN